MSITLSAAGELAGLATKRRPWRVGADFNAQGPQRESGSIQQSLQQVGARIRFTRGETIFCEGDDANQVYKLISGAVRLCKYKSNGRRHVADFMLESDFFGFTKCAEHDLTAEAVTDVIVVSYPRNQIERLGSETPAIERHFTALLSKRLFTLEHHLVVLGCQSAKERLASFLVRLSQRSGLLPGERLEVPMGRQDIADHLGLTIETVCRALSELKQMGLIVVPNANQLILKDVEGLRRLAEGESADDGKAPLASAGVISAQRAGSKHFAQATA